MIRLNAEKQSIEIWSLLGRVSDSLDADPKLAEYREPSAHDRSKIILTVTLPSDFERTANKQATHMTAKFDNGGWLVELSENSERVTGGWREDCIPSGKLKDFLNLWLDQHWPDQIDMFDGVSNG